jgi:hypothetical protein
MRGLRLGIPLVLALIVALAHPAAAEPVKIRVGWIVAPASLVRCSSSSLSSPSIQQILFIRSGAFRLLEFADHRDQPGRDRHRVVRLHEFPAGDSEWRLSDLRIIADEIQDGAPGYYSGPISCGRIPAIDKIEDMKGKMPRPTGSAAASTSSYARRCTSMALRRHATTP